MCGLINSTFSNQYLGFTVMSPLGFAMNGCVDTKERKSGNPKVLQIFEFFFGHFKGFERYSQFVLHLYASLMGNFSSL